jgi:hypothetical protein
MYGTLSFRLEICLCAAFIFAMTLAGIFRTL